MPPPPKDEKPSTLAQLLDFGAKDLTQRAQNGQLKRAYGRDAEVARVFAALERNRSVLLLGPAEVGKTAILHEMVYRMARRQCPDAFAGKWVVAVSTGDVLTGTHYLGEWQTRLTELLELVKNGKNVLLAFEDIWALRDAGRASDKAEGFATLIRPYLERGDIQLLGESTADNFNAGTYGARALADDHSLMKSFEIVPIDEPSPEASKSILTQVAKGLRQGGVVRIETSGVERAIELTRRFLPYQAFPGKAIRLLTEAAQNAEEAGAPPSGAERVVAAGEVTASFSRLHGLPEKILSDRTPLTQEELRAYFGERVIGQDEAVSAVSDIVTLIKAEMNDPTRPLGILFFVGPTGVGKTELAKTLAEYLFGSKDKLIRLDMSEFKSPLSISDLLAQLTEKQRRQTFSVLLLDEIEKASSVVFDLFLQVFSDGRLTDASGRAVDLRNTIVIMTSNLGNVEVEELSPRAGPIGFLAANESDDEPPPLDPAEARARLMRAAVEEFFRPEFINRLDKIVVFQPLGRDELRRIARRELGKALVLEGIVRRNILIDFHDGVLDALLAVGYSPQYGARPLQRAIREHVLLPLARTIAANPAIGEQLLELVAREGKIEAEPIPLTATEHEATQAEGLRERVPVVEAASGRARAMDAREVEHAIEEQRARIERHMEDERYEALRATQQTLLEEMGRPSFWDDQERSRRVLSEIYHIDRMTGRFADLRNRAENMIEAARMIRRHGDVAGLARLVESYERFEQEIALAEMELLAGGTPEALGVETVFLRIAPQASLKTQGVPGEAVEWARQLEAMYLGWARRKGYDAERVAEAAENADGVLLLRGPNLSRMLGGEDGLHRLEKNSDADPPAGRGRRKPSPPMYLARVEILPASDHDPHAARDHGDHGDDDEADGIQVRLLGEDGEGRSRAGRDAGREGEGRDGRDGREGRGGRDDGRARTVAEAREAKSGLVVRVHAQDAGRIARMLLAARLARQRAGAGCATSEEVVRVYHLGTTQFVHDKRTGTRDGQPKRVLGGGIDRFLLAYLLAQSRVTPAKAERNGHAE